MQLYETTLVRHGLMLVGETCSGKTCVRHTLQSALGHDEVGPSRADVAEHVINPKALSLPELYGSFDELSHEWSDGVLAVTFREAASSDHPPAARQWIVFDGKNASRGARGGQHGQEPEGIMRTILPIKRQSLT